MKVHMKPRDRVAKSSWNLHSTVKDVIAKNVATAARTGQIKVDATQLPALLALVSSSADEGFHNGNRSFMKTFDEVTQELVKDALVEAEFDLSKKK